MKKIRNYKILLAIFLSLSLSIHIKADDSLEITYDDLVKRRGLFYEVFSTTPFSGNVIGRYKSGKIREKGEAKNGKKTGDWIIYDDPIYSWQTVHTIAIETYIDGKKDGDRFDYFTDCSRPVCKVSLASFYKNDLLDGRWIRFNSQGKIIESGFYSYGLKEGVWETYDSSGIYLTEQGAYRSGKKNGVWSSYIGGTLISASTYRMNTLDGDQVQYYSNGEMREKRTLLNGSLVSKETYDKYGEVVNSLVFEDGKKTGRELIFYSNGQLETVESWKKGKKHGLWESFDQFGNLKKSEIFSNDQLDEVTTYDNSGDITEKTVFESDTSQVRYLYFPNGNLKKSITITNNQITQERTYVYDSISGEQYIAEGDEINGKKEGRWTFFNLEENLIAEGYFTNDLMDGEWTNFYTASLDQSNIDEDDLSWEDRILIFSNEKPTNQSRSQDPVVNNSSSNASNLNIDPIATKLDDRDESNTFEIFSQDYLPIAKVAPIYPARALNRGMEGWCIIEFTVTNEGSTADQKIVECSNNIFSKSSIKATAGFKYKPRVINGTAINVPGVQHKLTFQLE